MGVVGLALRASEVVPDEPVQTEPVRNAMLFLMGGLPLICFWVGAAIFTRCDLTESEHARIRAALDAHQRTSA